MSDKRGELFTAPAWFAGSRPTKDALKLTFAFSSNQFEREELGALIQLSGAEKPCFIMIKTADFDAQEEEIMRELQVEKSDAQKTPSERLFNTLFVLWSKRRENGVSEFTEFKPFYDHAMEAMITSVKHKIKKEEI